MYFWRALVGVNATPDYYDVSLVKNSLGVAHICESVNEADCPTCVSNLTEGRKTQDSLMGVVTYGLLDPKDGVIEVWLAFLGDALIGGLFVRIHALFNGKEEYNGPYRFRDHVK